MYHITIIEDDPVIREELTLLLQSNGYLVHPVTDFSNIINEVINQNPHLILLDINLPVCDGYKICSRIRSQSDVPIIFVTSRNTDMDELNGIMLGGDDFISKPYNTGILLVRISSLLKRCYSTSQKETMICHEITLHLESGKLEYNSNLIELTKNEQKILYLLFKNEGKIVSRTDIVEFLWDNQLYIDDNSLNVYITRLRDKLKQIGITDLIRTKHRQGYII